MTTFNCVIVDDEPLARNLLTDYVSKVPFLKLVQASSSPLEVLALLRTGEVHILFLDIQMPDITGIDFLKVLQNKPQVILTTAYSEYALEGYDLDVVDYLLKPVTFERFLKAVDRAVERIQSRPASETPVTDKEFVFVKDGTKLVRVNFDDILYVEGLKDYVTIHTKTKKIVTLQRLKALETQLPADRFARVHHSFIVAIKAIDVVHKNEVQIGSATIPISDTYRKGFRDVIEKNQMP